MKFRYKNKMFNIEGISEKDHIYRQIVEQGRFYEIDLLKYMFDIKSFANKKHFQNIVIDVGANIGNHSVFFGSFLANHLITIEPNPNVLPILKRNLQNNINNYTLFECAVGDKECKGTIFIPDNNEENVGMAKVDVDNNEGNVEIFTLEAIFKKWLNVNEQKINISFIKIDVEGMELLVLKGAEDLLKKYNPQIFAEASTDDELVRIWGFLKTLGYKKMPGHLSATPVYHFVYKSSPGLLMISYFYQLKRLLKETYYKLVSLIRKTGL